MAQSPGFIHGHGPSASQFPSVLGQTVAAASLSVVLASDYTLPVTITTTAATPLYTRLSNGTTAYDTVIGAQLPATLGSKTGATSLSIVLASDATLPLPTGAATSAKQDTGNTSLASINTKLPAVLGQAVMASSLSVTVASDQAAISVQQAGTWTITGISGTVSLPTGAATAARQDTGNTSLASIDSKLGATVTVTDTGRSSVLAYTNDNTSAAVTTAAYTQVVASTTAKINRLYISDTSGSPFQVATGASGSETVVLYIPPGGTEAPYELAIAASTRIAVKALDANMSSGRLIITGLS